MPKVSVIIPVYNVEKYLRECLDSVQSQTLRDIEILCINDGSKDGSAEILAEYAKNDDRFVVINQENSGVSASRNKAIKLAKGEFVTFMDSDDLYPKADVLEKLYNKAKENDVLVSGGEFGQFVDGENPRVYDPKCGDEIGYIFAKEGICEYKDYQFDFGFHRFIYNREFLLENELEFPIATYFEDPIFFVKTLAKAGRFYALKEITYGYRTKHTKSKWDKAKTKFVLDGIETNLDFAVENGFERLKKITLRRVCDFSKLVCNDWKSYPQLFRICKKGNELKIFFHYYCMEPVLEWIFSIKNDYSTGDKIKYLTILGIKFRLGNKEEFPTL